MAKQRTGWRVTAARGRFLGWAWDPAAGKYRTRAHDTRTEATRWARQTHAAFVTCLDTIAQPRDLAALAAEYQEHLRRRGRTDGHVGDVGLVLADLGRFVAALDADGAEAAAARWWAEVGRSGRAARTQNRYLVTAKAFAKWAVRQRVSRSNPLERVDLMKVAEHVKPQWTVAELQRMAACDLTDPFRVRFAVFCYAGLRAGEVYALRREHWDQEGGVLLVAHGKGGKQRLVPVQPALEAVLAADDAWAQDGFLVGDADLRASTKRQWTALRQFLRRVGIPVQGRGQHSFRHTYAGLMTATGVPSLLLQQYMGHGQGSTTAEYAKLATRYERIAGAWGRGRFPMMATTEACAVWVMRQS